MIRNLGLFSIVLIGFFACNQPVKKEKVSTIKNKESVELPISSAKEVMSEEQKLAIKNLVDVQTINPSIRVELKYATTDNFMGKKLYDTLVKAYLQKDIAERLSECQEMLSRLKPGYSLLVYDAMRPRKIQQKMWDALDSIPFAKRGKFVSNPRNGSVHNYGAAVDLTICDQNGKPLDMGAKYDEISEIAYPSKETEFLSKGELNVTHLENRRLLRKVMRRGQFINLPTEWWHFNAYPRIVVRRKYDIIE